jgi:hypothetical protein
MGIFNFLLPKKRQQAPQQRQSTFVVQQYDTGMYPVYRAQEMALPEVAEAAGRSEVKWYMRESSAKKCKQVILAEKAVSPCKSPIGGPFIHTPLMRVRAWGMGTVYSDNIPYLCVKCVGVEDAIKTVPCRLAFGFYRFAEAGLFQPLLEIAHDASKPFLTENPWNLRGSEGFVGLVKDFLSRSYLVLQFFDANMLGVHARVITPPADCMAAIRSLFEEARKYDSTIRNQDFRAAEKRYYDTNPADESPILRE